MTHTPRRRAQLLPTALLSLLLAAVGGCGVFMVGALLVPPPYITPKYVGFQNQTVAVMVWVEPGIRMSFDRLQLDLATAVQNRLDPSDPKMASDDFKGATFPVLPASVVRWQLDNPEYDGADVGELAVMIGQTRLIYIEIEDFRTRSDVSGELYRGKCYGALKVAEVNDGVGTEAFAEEGIQAVYPPDSGEEGIMGLGDQKAYTGVVNAFADEISRRLKTYQEEY